ncbi:Ras GTPase [Tulasnella sp. 427]|nr:Ras GTPase [Tulasnella sp. 427]
MREQYMRTGEGFLLVYSITSRNSFEEISTFHQQILRVKDKDFFPVIVIGNKCDLEYERQVGMNATFVSQLGMANLSHHKYYTALGHALAHLHLRRRLPPKLEGRDLAKHFGCPFLETSAKQRIHVDDAFIQLVQEIRKYNKEQASGRPGGPSGSGPQSSAQFKSEEDDHSGGCCCVVA